jgi:hypothetical protein
MKAYVDGSLVGSSDVTTGNLNAGDQRLQVGCRFYGTNQPFNGVIDEVRVYNRAKSADEIAELYAWTGP